MKNVEQKQSIGNNTLATLLIIVIFVSFLGTWQSLMRLQGITGAATTALGYVNVTINETVGISMVTAIVNFTSAVQGQTRATIIASDYNTGPLNLTNDGGTVINVSITDTQTIFSSASFARATHYVYNVTLADITTNAASKNCSLGYSNGLSYTYAAGGWRAMPSAGAETPICRLNFTDGKDSVRVDINITVPSDEAAGEKRAKITFTGLVTPAT